jgi:anti-sigma factor RsiW
MTHPDAETLVGHVDGLLDPETAETVNRHLATCAPCADVRRSMGQLTRRLGRERVSAALVGPWLPPGCPSVQTLASYFLDEAEPGERTHLRAHIAGCESCRGVLAEMNQGASELDTRFGSDVSEALEAPVVGPKLSLGERLRHALGLLPWPGWALAATAVALAFALGYEVAPDRSGSTAPGRVASVLGRRATPPYAPDAGTPGLGIGAPGDPEADRRFRQAMTHHGDPNFATKALPGLREAVALDARHDAAQFWLGIALLLTGDLEHAIAPLEAAVALAPARREYRDYLLWAYLATDRVDAARQLQSRTLGR